MGESGTGPRSTKTAAAIAPLAERYPSGFGLLLGAAEWRAGPAEEIVITGSLDDPTFHTLRQVACEEFLLHRVFVAGSGSADLPLKQNRSADRVLAYVCETYTCAEPTDNSEVLRTFLRVAL